MDFVASFTPYMPIRFLRLEADRPGVVVDFLSSLAILFCQAATEEGSRDPLALRLTFTAIQGLLPGFQLARYSWL